MEDKLNREKWRRNSRTILYTGPLMLLKCTSSQTVGSILGIDAIVIFFLRNPNHARTAMRSRSSLVRPISVYLVTFLKGRRDESSSDAPTQTVAAPGYSAPCITLRTLASC